MPSFDLWMMDGDLAREPVESAPPTGSARECRQFRACELQP